MVYGYGVIGLLVIILALLTVWFVLPYAAKKFQIADLRQRSKAGRFIVLTYDDGPGSRMTGKLLDLLRSYRAVATFFLIGSKLDSSRGTVDEIIRGGHEVGSHSYRHLHAFKCSPISVFQDIAQGLRATRSVVPCHLFRAPYGKVTLLTWIQVSLLGCKQSWWTVDSTDTWDSPREIGDILEQVRRQGGGIVLLHDLDRPGQPEREEFVLKVTAGLLEMAKAERFRVCTLSEALNK